MSGRKNVAPSCRLAEPRRDLELPLEPAQAVPGTLGPRRVRRPLVDPRHRGEHLDRDEPVERVLARPVDTLLPPGRSGRSRCSPASEGRPRRRRPRGCTDEGTCGNVLALMPACPVRTYPSRLSRTEGSTSLQPAGRASVLSGSG